MCRLQDGCVCLLQTVASVRKCIESAADDCSSLVMSAFGASEKNNEIKSC